MDSNQKLLPSPPPPPPPPPPKNGNTAGRPVLISAKLHDGDSGAVGVGDMEAAALRRGSPRAHGLSRSGQHELFRSGRHELSGSSRHEERGSRARHSRVMSRLGLGGLGTVAAVDDRPYTCAVCSMTFGRETALCGHLKSHKRDHLSSDSEEDAPTPKRRRKQKKRLRTVKPFEATWGNHARRNGIPRDGPAEVNVSESESGHSSNDISLIVIDDDDDDTNPVISVAGSHGASGLAAEALAMAPAPAVVVATPTPAPHVATASVNTEGQHPIAPFAPSTAAVTIPPAPASAVAATITRALATAVNASTQTSLNLVKGNNSSGQAGGRCRYVGNDEVFARNSNSSGKFLAGYGIAGHNDAIHRGKGVAGHNDAIHRGKGVAGYSRGTAAGGESSEGHKCSKCDKVFRSSQALGGHITSGHKNTEKEKLKLGLQSGRPHKCLVCNFVCQTRQELNTHLMSVHVAGDASANMGKNFEATGVNSIGAAVDGPYNTMGRRIPASAPRSVVLAHPASTVPLQQPPQQTSAVAPGNHGHRNINPALFPFSRRQEIALVPSNGIASSSSGPRPGVAATTEPSQARINNYFAAIDAPANTMGSHLPFFLAGRSNTQALPVSWPAHHPTQGMAAMAGNRVTGNFPAAMAVNGWTAHHPTQGMAAMAGNHVTGNFPAAMAVNGWPAHHPTQGMAAMAGNHFPAAMAVNGWPAHHPTQGMAAMSGNTVTTYFPAAMAVSGWSFPASTTSVLPAIPLQTQQENPPHGRVVPVNGEHPSTSIFGSNSIPTFPSQNQAENPPGEIVPSNNGGGHNITLFGTNIAEGQKEDEGPK